MSFPDQSAARRQALACRGLGPSLAVAAAVLAGAWPAAAQDPAPGYPMGHEAHEVLPWLAAHTSVQVQDIVVIGPQAVVSLDQVTAGDRKGAPALAIVREEIIDEDYARRRRVRSARLEVELDCATGAYEVRKLTQFTLPNFEGEETAGPARAGWGHAADATPMAMIGHSACARLAAARPAPAPRAPASVAANAPILVSTSPILLDAAPSAPETVRSPGIAAVGRAPLPAVVLAAAAPAVAAPITAPPSPTPAALTAFKVQLGSYSTAENAARASADLRRDFPKAVREHDVTVDPASSNGRGYFLVLVQGFAQRADAAAFCKVVDATPTGCMIRR